MPKATKKAKKPVKAWKPVGRLTLHGAGELTLERRKEMAKWLRYQAAFLVKDGHNFAKTYTAKYHAFTG